ncbi:MAG: glutamine amidotransferase, partial [Aestuariivirga sp.]
KRDSDRKLVIDHAPEYILVGEEATINFHVEDQGGNGSDVPVTISLPGEDPQNLVVKPGAAAEVNIPISHAGQNFISLSAEVRPGELSAANNTELAIVNGIRDRLRVLLVSGEPNAGERTWRNLLKADTSVDLIHFTILRPAEKQDATPLDELSLIAFPTKELFVDKLTKFDLVIFDRYTRESVLPDEYLANVADYVRDGGALLIASGPDFAEVGGLASTPLDDVLAAEPTSEVTETPFKPKLSEIGEKHPITQNLKGASRTDPKWGEWFRLIDATPITSDGDTQVLLEGPDAKPLLVTRRVGKGRVAQLLSDQGWLWARGYDGGGPEADLLKRIAHWAMKQPELEEERIAAHGQGTDIIVDRYGLKPTYESATARSPSGKESQVPLKEVGPGHFQGRFTPDEAGTYALLDGPLQAVAVAGNGDAKEVNDLLATTKKLEPVTAATGGGIFWLEDGMPRLTTQGSSQSYAGAGYMALRANGQTRTLAVRELDLFATLLSLAALLVLISLMWRREGR